MLSRIHFTNFKSWALADMPCGKITGVFGTNSSGKTSLLQFILMLKQTKDASDRATALDLNGDYVKLGTIWDVVHQHKDNLDIAWRLKFELESELALNDASGKRNSLFARSKSLQIASGVEIGKSGPITQELWYKLGNSEFSIKPKDLTGKGFDLESSGSDFSFLRNKGRAWQLPGPIKSYAFPDQARTYYQNAGFLSDLEAAYEGELNKIYYLGPLREYPQRDYLWARSKPSDVGKRGEKAIDAILAATDAELTRNLRPKAHLKPFQEMIAYWLREMGLIDQFSVVEIAKGSNRWQARVRTRPGSSEVMLTDVGFGVSQVLPVITLLQYVPEGSTVLLEQPEIHLHPLAQAGLADVIIQAAIHRNVQVILESHSEHLLLRLQRRIAEGALMSEHVKLYFCDAPDGKSSLTPLEVDLLGNIHNWPERFMGDAFNEVAEAELARMRSKRASN